MKLDVSTLTFIFSLLSTLTWLVWRFSDVNNQIKNNKEKLDSSIAQLFKRIELIEKELELTKSEPPSLTNLRASHKHLKGIVNRFINHYNQGLAEKQVPLDARFNTREDDTGST